MIMCEECRLPLHICNALSFYHKAVEAYQRGRIETAADFAAGAKEYYELYIAEMKGQE